MMDFNLSKLPYFSYDGEDSRDFNLAILETNTMTVSVPRYETIEIPGRNGVILSPLSTFENVDIYYKVRVFGVLSNMSMDALCGRLSAWLTSKIAYKNLLDSYRPGYFRQGFVKNALTIEKQFREVGDAKITFSCKPFLYSDVGQTPVSFSAPSDIVNPEAFPSTPLIVVHGSGAGSVTIGGTVVTINAMDGELYLDSDTENAYSLSAGVPVNQNGSIYAPEFPRLQPGENSVAWTGGVTGLEITPRWWTL